MGLFLNPFQAPSKTFGPVNGATGYNVFVPFVATAATTLGDSVVETSLLSTSSAYGTKTIPAGYLSAGSMIKVYITGTIGTAAVVPSVTLKVYYGSTVLTTAAVTPAAQVTAAFFEYTSTIKVISIGSSGSLGAAQVMWINSLLSGNVASVQSTQTVNTTVAGAIDVKITWGTADALNTISAVTGYIEVIG